MKVAGRKLGVSRTSWGCTHRQQLFCWTQYSLNELTSTKKECDELAGGPAFQRLAAQVLHGDIGQAQRETTLAQFRRGGFTVLVATDVAARGIDVKGVDLVVQYRTPRDAEGYVHRSGRTGRAGRDGTAVVLYDEREQRDVKSLERQTGVTFTRQGPPSSAQVLGAAAADASMALAKVEDTVLPYFDEGAAALCAAELGVDAADVDEQTKRLVAKCLAAIARAFIKDKMGSALALLADLFEALDADLAALAAPSNGGF